MAFCIVILLKEVVFLEVLAFGSPNAGEEYTREKPDSCKNFS